MESKQLHVFDICGTLFYSNTTYDFLMFYFKRNNGVKYICFRLCFSVFLKVIWKVFSIVGMGKGVRRFLLSFIKGESASLVREEAIVFSNYLFEQKRITETHLRLQNVLKNNDTVWLVSASIEPIVSAIASHFDSVNFIATELEIMDGVYTGKISCDLERRKAEVLQRKSIIKSNTKLVTYTDSMNDGDLVTLSESAFIVCSSDKQQKWRNKYSANIKLEFSHEI